MYQVMCFNFRNKILPTELFVLFLRVFVDERMHVFGTKKLKNLILRQEAIDNEGGMLLKLL